MAGREEVLTDALEVMRSFMSIQSIFSDKTVEDTGASRRSSMNLATSGLSLGGTDDLGKVVRRSKQVLISETCSLPN